MSGWWSSSWQAVPAGTQTNDPHQAAALLTLNRHSSFFFLDAGLFTPSTSLPGSVALKLPFMMGSSWAGTFRVFCTMTV
uniref:Uncharacterized protein n=1 Tax=Zea mays TaxID=4577 RepID=C0PG77_MAIZE|nr:unknown [Zea mays]